MVEMNYEVEYKSYFDYTNTVKEETEVYFYCDYSGLPIDSLDDFIEVDGLVILEEYYNDYMEEREDD